MLENRLLLSLLVFFEPGSQSASQAASAFLAARPNQWFELAQTAKETRLPFKAVQTAISSLESDGEVCVFVVFDGSPPLFCWTPDD